MNDFMTEYDTYCAQYGVPERIDLMLCDLNAVLRGKWLPASEVSKLVGGKVRLPLSTYAPNIFGFELPETGLGIVQGDPDGTLIPIAGTLKPVPWAEGNVAQVLVEMYEIGGPVTTLSPRQILQNTLDKFEAKGLSPVVASELEFYVLAKRNDVTDPPRPPDHTPDAQNYDLEVLSRSETLLRAIQAASKTLGLPIDTMIAEFGPGQFEINFHHTEDVLSAADTAVLFRRVVRGVSAEHGMEATFMAKPYADHPGNGMHLHVSVLDADGLNIFDHDGDSVAPALKHAVAGTLSTMPDFQAIFAPHMNSYRRFFVGGFAPCAPDWGIDNRNAGVRLPETRGPGARLEHRICGADVNPYLAFTAILAGILHGLDTQLEPPLPLEDENSISAFPLTTVWAESVNTFATSKMAAQVFGEAYRDIYAILRRDEINQLTAEITPQEYRTYLSRL
jgi:glutamine synthetase